MNKKKLITIISAVLVCALVFGVFLMATEDVRYLKGEMKGIQEQVDDFRSGESDSFHIFFLDEVAQNPQMDEFLVSLVIEMCENKETDMLTCFLGELEYIDFNSKNVLNALKEHFGSAKLSSLKDYERLTNDADDMNLVLDYYKVQTPSVSRDTEFIAEYIKKNGTKAISTKEGEGFYAHQENEHKKDVVGLPTSPLHNSKSVTYVGDFKYVHTYGVRLNGYYEETSYSNYINYFRDNTIGFTHDDGELVWSGDYLFCFSHVGVLLDYASVK